MAVIIYKLKECGHYGSFKIGDTRICIPLSEAVGRSLAQHRKRHPRCKSDTLDTLETGSSRKPVVNGQREIAPQR